MKTGAIIGWSLLGVAVLATGTFFAVRSINSKKEYEMTVDIGTVDWVNRKVPFAVNVNGKREVSGVIPWRSDLVGKGELQTGANKKNVHGEIHLTNGLVIYTKSLGASKGAKIIDFNSKTVKDFKGNAANAIAGAAQTIKDLFA